MKTPVDLALGEAAVLADIQALASGKVDAARVAAVRSNVKYGQLMSRDRASRVAVEAAVSTAWTGDIGYQDKMLQAIGNVQPQALVAFARKYLVAANSTTVTLQTETGPSTSSAAGMN